VACVSRAYRLPVLPRLCMHVVAIFGDIAPIGLLSKSTRAQFTGSGDSFVPLVETERCRVGALGDTNLGYFSHIVGVCRRKVLATRLYASLTTCVCVCVCVLLSVAA